MKLSTSIFFNFLVHSTDAMHCDHDAWVNCEKYRYCVTPKEGENYYRTVFCTAGNVPAEYIDFHGGGADLVGITPQITCIPKASLACDEPCAGPCEPEPTKPAPECFENSVSPISCTKYQMCINGIERTVHCNAGLVHDGESTECNHESELPIGHECGPYIPPTPTPECEESVVEAVTCTSYRMCIGGINRLVHCNAGLVHDGISTGCIRKEAISPGAPCGPPGCEEGTVESRSCSTFRLCANGAMHLIHCNEGLVHDGMSANCVPPSELSCGYKCGLECPSCVSGHVIPIDCSQFHVCVGGAYKIIFCNGGLVHVGPEAHCIRKSSVPCGTLCGNACPVVPVSECEDGSVLPLTCKTFKYCVDGQYKISTCRGGLVHLGVEARCVPKSSVQCGTTCGGACPPECEDGSASPVSCKKFKYCVSGKWKMSYCKRGLVHASEEAVCVDPSSLECDGKCAPLCPPECQNGAFIPIDCDKFRYCHNGKWKTSYCHGGLVNMGDDARCVAQADLACGSKCAIECPTPVSDCEPGQIDDSSCTNYATCDGDGYWHTTVCGVGTVHIPGARCVDQDIIDCKHECGPSCPPPAHTVEFKCPCDEIRDKLTRLRNGVKMMFENEIEDACDSETNDVVRPHIHIQS